MLLHSDAWGTVFSKLSRHTPSFLRAHCVSGIVLQPRRTEIRQIKKFLCATIVSLVREGLRKNEGKVPLIKADFYLPLSM